MGKARKRRRLLRVAIASGLLVIAVPSVAAAHEHLTPVEALDLDRQAATEKAACSMDPRDPRLMNPGAQLCSDRVAAVQVPTGQERAEIQHLVPEGNEGIDQAPAPSDGTEIEIWAWMLSIVVAAGGTASFFLLRRGRPHALS
jgi:hypothetical protein